MWALGDFFNQAFPELDTSTGDPVFNPSTPTIGVGSTYSAWWQRFDGVASAYPLTGGRLYVTVPQDETWDVTVSFDLNRAASNLEFMAFLASGNPGYPGEVIDVFTASTVVGSDTAERVTLSGRCNGNSGIIFLVDRRGSIFVENFDSDGVFVAPYEIPTWILGDFSEDILTEYSLPNPPDPDSGLPIIQATRSPGYDQASYHIASVRENSATPVPGVLDFGLGPVVLKQLKINIPDGEVWDVTFQGNIDRIDQSRVASVSLMQAGDPFEPTNLLDYYLATLEPGADPDIPGSEAFEATAQVTNTSYFGFMLDARGGVDINLMDSSGVFVFDTTPETPTFQLTWWEPGSKTYERGVDRGVLYFDDGRVVPWNGLTKVEEQFGVSSESVYFDGIKLSEVPIVEGFSAKVSAITYPDQLESAYGNLELRNGVYLGEQGQKSFGFSYRNKLGTDLDEDAGYKIHLVYNVIATPNDKNYTTISDDPSVIEFSWEFVSVPETLHEYASSAHLVLDTSEISPGLLDAIESILYGTDTIPPRLPPLYELIDLINDFENFITITDNGDGTWSANTDASGVINDLGSDVFEIQHATIQITGPDSYLISSTPDPPTI